MAGSSNFLPFNPGKANQASDSNYNASTYRLEGIPAAPSAAPSIIHNKLFYQTSIGVAALMQSLANQGYTASDDNLSDLVILLSTLANTRGFAMNGALHQSNPVSLTSVSGTLTLTEAGNSFVASGTENLTAITGWTSGIAIIRWNTVRSLVYNAGSLILQSGANRTTKIGEISVFEMTSAGAREIKGPNNDNAIPPGGGAIPFHGSFGGAANKNPIDKFTGVANPAWQICDGTNGTCDLRERFVLGAGETYTVGSTGGEINHALTIPEIPAHRHVDPYSEEASPGVPANGFDAVPGGNAAGSASSDGNQPLSYGGWEGGTNYNGDPARKTAPTIVCAAHNNMPPYYAIAYIERIA